MVAIHAGFDPNEARDKRGRWATDDTRIKYEYGACAVVVYEKVKQAIALGDTSFSVVDGEVRVEGGQFLVPHVWIETWDDKQPVYDPTVSQFKGREVEYYPKDGSGTKYSPCDYLRYQEKLTGITTHAKKPGHKTINPLKSDPSQTITIRRSFVTDLTKRYRTVRETINQALDYSTGWPHKTPKQKVAEMRRWLSVLTEQHVKTKGTASTEPWLAKYVRQAYTKGATRAFDGANFMQGTAAYKAGYKEQFLNGHKRRYEEATEMIVESSAERIQALTNEINSWALDEVLWVVSRKGTNKQIKKVLKDTFDRIIKAKAKLYVSDIVIGTHAEGMLDSYEDLGVEQVGVRAEWLTAGDDRVCPLCKRHEGLAYRIDEARGLIPLHPRCRCTWIPAKSNRADRFKKVVKVSAKLIKKKQWMKSFVESRA